MATTTPSPIFGLPMPVPTQDPSPQWATDLNIWIAGIEVNCFSLLNPVIPGGITISSDLTFAGHNATNLNAVRLLALANAPSSGADVGEIVNVGGNLTWVNGAGTAVQISKGSGLNTDGLVNNNWTTKPNVSGNFTIGASDGYVVYLVNTSTVAAIITLPSAAGQAAGRFIVIEDASQNSETNNITLTPNATDNINGSNTNLVFKSNGASMTLVCDGVANWYVSQSSHRIVNSTGLNGALINLTSSSTIGLSGTTISLNGSTGVNLQVAGSSVVSIAGSTATIPSGKTLSIAGSVAITSFPSFLSPQTRVIQVPCNIGVNGTGVVAWGFGLPGATDINPSISSTPAVLYIPLNAHLHQGATLNTATLSFRVGGLHTSGLPANGPQFGIVRTDTSDNTTSLTSTSVQNIPMGGSGSAWHAGGGIQTFAYTPTQNNVIDKTAYTYAIWINSEYGNQAQTGDAFLFVELDFGSINTFGWA